MGEELAPPEPYGMVALHAHIYTCTKVSITSRKGEGKYTPFAAQKKIFLVYKISKLF